MRPKKVREFKSKDFELVTDVSSTEDDNVEKDPDWIQTPLYNRIQNLLVIGKAFIFVIYIHSILNDSIIFIFRIQQKHLTANQ